MTDRQAHALGAFMPFIFACLMFGLVEAQAPAAPAAPPTVSELTRTQAELAATVEVLAQTQAQLAQCRAGLAPAALEQNLKAVDAERAKIVAAFEQDHPGWTIDPKTLAVTKKAGGAWTP